MSVIPGDTYAERAAAGTLSGRQDSTFRTGLAIAPAGITGAQQSSRYVGATLAGAPTSGTFFKGDFVIDQAGTIWICTTAGSPGLWTSGTNRELGRAERTSNTAALGPAYVDVPGLIITVTPPTSALELEAYLPDISKDATASYVNPIIVTGTSGSAGQLIQVVHSIAASGFGSVTVRGKVTGLTPGTPVSYHLGLQCGAGTATLISTAITKAYLRALIA